MKLILPAVLVLLLILLGLCAMLFVKVQALEGRLKEAAASKDVQARFEDGEERMNTLKYDVTKFCNQLSDRIDALEAGTAKKRPQGPVTAEFVLSELETQIYMKKDAFYEPDKEAAAQAKIEEDIQTLVKMAQTDEGIPALLVERVRSNRDPELRMALLRDVAWRLGPAAAPELMSLFREKDFTSNLRGLAAASAIKTGVDEKPLLEEFVQHLEDPQEYLTVKTELVRILQEHPFAGAVDCLIQGALDPGYAESHRFDCLRALSRYDNPKVIRTLEEILERQDENVWVVNLAIQAYYAIMGEKAIPFFRKLLEEGKAAPVNRDKLNEIVNGG